MRVCVVAGKHTDEIVGNLQLSLDVHSFEGTPELASFIHDTDVRNAEYDRVLIFDDKKKNDVYSMLQLVGFLDNHEDFQILYIVSSEARKKFFTDNVNSANTLAVQSNNITSLFLKELVDNSFSDLVETYGSGHQASYITARSVEETRNPVNSTPDFGSALDLSNAGETHADTGFLEEDFEAAPRPSASRGSRSSGGSRPSRKKVESNPGGYPPLTVNHWESYPEDYPGFDFNDDGDYPYMDFRTRVIICVSANPAHSTAHASAQADRLSSDGHSVLYVDFQQTDLHGITKIIEDPESFKTFQPKIKHRSFYQEGNVFFATNGVKASYTQNDVETVVDCIKWFDYTVIDMTFDSIRCLPTILESYPETAIVWCIDGTGSGVVNSINLLYDRILVPSDVITPFSHRVYIHPGRYEKSLQAAVKALSPKFVWDRDSFQGAFEELLTLPAVR